MDFIQLDLGKANRLINHGPTILVTARHEERENLMTAAWCMPVSKKPPMLAVAVGPSRFTHDLIIESKEFTVCIPGRDLAEQVMCCGTTSGLSGKDKFAFCGLTLIRLLATTRSLSARCWPYGSNRKSLTNGFKWRPPPPCTI
jgi:flavin reductase (DIM6/NTAB) family NADH-FMN oxidoreductase RutF